MYASVIRGDKSEYEHSIINIINYGAKLNTLVEERAGYFYAFRSRSRKKVLAGIAGVLDGIKNSAISPHMGLEVAIKGLVVMLLGGLGNVPGAMVAGLLLGMIEILTSAYLGTSMRDFFTFVILILILMYRPTGLFGTRTTESG